MPPEGCNKSKKMHSKLYENWRAKQTNANIIIIRFQEDRKFKYEETDGEKSNITFDIKVNLAHRSGVSINVSLTYLIFRKTVELCLVSLQFQ